MLLPVAVVVATTKVISTHLYTSAMRTSCEQSPRRVCQTSRSLSPPLHRPENLRRLLANQRTPLPISRRLRWPGSLIIQTWRHLASRPASLVQPAERSGQRQRRGVAQATPGSARRADPPSCLKDGEVRRGPWTPRRSWSTFPPMAENSR